MISIITILLSLSFILVTALIDAEHISKGQYIIDHNTRFIQRALFSLSIAVFDWKLSVISGVLFAVLFDQVLNICLNRPLFNFGSTSKWDKFFRKNKVLYALIKIASLIIAFLLLYI